jgi:hypothetical protein
MPSKIAQDVQYRCWCEADDCAWTDTGAARSVAMAAKRADGATVGHTLATGHATTRRVLDD